MKKAELEIVSLNQEIVVTSGDEPICDPELMAIGVIMG